MIIQTEILIIIVIDEMDGDDYDVGYKVDD